MSKSTGIGATTVIAVVEGFMEEAAEEKFKAVNQAYEAICRERGI